ncbi:MAG: transposase [Oscillospiraceae bacterium]
MKLPQRKNHRLKKYDYCHYGYYYVTICVHNRQNILCDIVGCDALVAPSKLGKKIISCCNNIALLNENVELDKFVVMPNHIHGIIILKNTDISCEKVKNFSFEIAERRGRRSLQGLVKDFKSVTTRYYKKLYGKDTSLWQISFYDEVIKNQEYYIKICNYIDTNPLKWQIDELYENP